MIIKQTQILIMGSFDMETLKKMHTHHSFFLNLFFLLCWPGNPGGETFYGKL